MKLELVYNQMNMPEKLKKIINNYFYSNITRDKFNIFTRDIFQYFLTAIKDSLPSICYSLILDE